MPEIGVAAAVGLILFVVGAFVTAVRAHWYAHFPTGGVAPAGRGALVP